LGTSGLWWTAFMKKVSFEPEVKREGKRKMDCHSDNNEKVIS